MACATNLWQIFSSQQLQAGTAGNLTSDTLLASLVLEQGVVIFPPTRLSKHAGLALD